MRIVRPVTDDGLVGFDEHGQFVVTWQDGDSTVMTFLADVRRVTCAICGRGWEATGPAMRDQMRWDLVDGYVHRTCLDRHTGLVERAEFFRALVDAQVRFRGLTAIENGYWRDRTLRPWYLAELIDHPVAFKLGSRKRVDHVEVIAQGGVPLAWSEEARKAFDAEDVTKEFSAKGILVHAWTTEKMRAYIKTLVEVGGLAKEITS